MPKNAEERIIDSPYAAVRRGGSSSSGGGSNGDGGGGGGSYIAGNGISIIDNVIAAKIKPNSALAADALGLYVVKPVTSGLIIDAAGVRVGQGDGISVLATTVAVNAAQIIDPMQGLQVDGSNNIQAKLDAVSGMLFDPVSGGFKLGTPGQINLSSQNQVTANSHAHDIDTASDVSAGLSEILQSSAGNLKLQTLDLNGNLHFFGGNRLVTASNGLTIQPASDLWLDPLSDLIQANNDTVWRSQTIADAPTGILGWNLWHRGGNQNQLTITSIKADELFVRFFTADETRIHRGEILIGKSFGIVESDFVLPADEGTVDVWFEAVAALPGFDIFEVGDWLQARTIDLPNGGLQVMTVWFTVVAKLGDDTRPDGIERQQWRIKRESGGLTGATVHKSSDFLDAGVPTAQKPPGQLGDGVIFMTALNASLGSPGPAISLGYFESVLDDVPQFAYPVRLGNLRNSVDYTVDTWGFVAGNDLGLTPSGGFSGLVADAQAGLRLFNSDITIYDANIPVLALTRDEGLLMRQDLNGLTDMRKVMAWYDDLDAIDDETILGTLPESVVGSYLFTNSGLLTRQMELYVSAGDVDGASIVALRALESFSPRDANLLLESRATLSTGAIDSRIRLSAEEVWIRRRLQVGDDTADDIGTLHISDNTGVGVASDRRVGQVIEQQGSGDSVLHWYREANGAYFSAGIQGGVWKLSASETLGVSDFIIVNPTTGVVSIPGFDYGSSPPPLDVVGGDGIDVAGNVISVDSTVARSDTAIIAGNGLQGGGDLTADRTLSVRLPTFSGLSASASGLMIADSLAGNGLDITNKVLRVVAVANGGITVGATGVAVDGTVVRTGREVNTVLPLQGGGPLSADLTLSLLLQTPYSGLVGDASGLRVRDDIAGDGLTILNKILAVGAGLGITVSANAVAVNEAQSFNWMGNHTFTPPDRVRINAPLWLDGDLQFIGAAHSITSAAQLTIQPSGHLVLDPTGLIVLPDDQEFRTSTISDLITGITGMRLWVRADGKHQMTLGALKMDELYTRVFVADETRVDRGAEYWSKSFGVVESDFILPAVGSTVDVWFEDAPGLPAGTNLFSNNDYLLLRAIDWGTGLVIQEIWCQVQFKTVTDSANYRQGWRLLHTRGGFASMVVKKGSVAIDVGQIGQGWIHLSALVQDGGPFIQIGDMTSVAGGRGFFTNRVRMGNLAGTVDYGSVATWGFAAGNNLGLSPASGFSGLTADASNGLRLFNTDFLLYEGPTPVVTIDRSRGMIFDFDTGEFVHLTRWIQWQADVLQINPAYFAGIGAYHDQPSGANVFFMKITGPSGTNPHYVVEAQQVTSAGAYIRGSTLWIDATFSSLSGGNARVYLRDDLGVVITKSATTPTPASTLHIYEASTSIDATGGVTIEQAGSGDALLQWLAGGRRFVMGIDNSDDEKFKISLGAPLGSNDILIIDPLDRIPTVVGDAARLSISGATSAGLNLIDQDATANQRHIGLINAGNRTRFVNYDDSGTARIDNILGFSHLTGYVGVGTGGPISTFHVYESTGTTGVDTGITIEQAGSGDAILQFLTTGVRRMVMGIDRSDGSKFKIGRNPSLGVAVDDLLIIDPTATTTTINTPLNVAGNVIADRSGANTIIQASQADNTLAAMLRTVADVTDMRFLSYGSAAAGTRGGLPFANAGEFLVVAGDRFLVTAVPNIPIHFLTNATLRMTLASYGYLGIGISNPISPLHVQENTGTVTNNAGISVTQLGGGDALLNLTAGGQLFQIGVDNSLAGRPLRMAAGADLSTNDAIAFTLTTAGRVGIGEPQPGARLAINSEGAQPLWMQTFGTVAPSLYAWRARGSQSAPGSVLAGDVLLDLAAHGYAAGYGTTPAAMIRMRAAQDFTASSRGAYIAFEVMPLNNVSSRLAPLQILSDGALIALQTWTTHTSGTGQTRAMWIDQQGKIFSPTSSRRHKEQIEALPSRYSDFWFKRLRPVSFHYRQDEQKVAQLGLIAEEVHESGAKELVSYDEQGEPNALHYDKLIVPLIATVQRLMARVEALEAQRAAR